MKEKMGFMWPPVKGTVTSRKRKALMKTAKGTRSFGSGSFESKHEVMDAVRVNMSAAVATSSVSDALHIWKDEDKSRLEVPVTEIVLMFL